MYDINILDNLFDKYIICFVCNLIFIIKIVKFKLLRIIFKDFDFFIWYKVINFYFYDVCICNFCGYVVMRLDFEKIKLYRKELVFSNIILKW